jgi:transposase IS4-like protein
LHVQSGMPAAVGRRAFAAGQLGELTQIITPELVDDVLAVTRRVQRRVRKLPSRVVVYFILATTLFPGCGYAGVWASMTAGAVRAAARPGGHGGVGRRVLAGGYRCRVRSPDGW